MEFESLKKENQRIEAKLAIKRNQVSQLLQMWNSKMVQKFKKLIWLS